jgi:outer membrane protein assembly factor BamB
MMDRPVIFAAVTLLVLHHFGCTPPPDPVSTDTAMFRGNPQHTGVYDTNTVRHFDQVQWAFETGGPVRSSPAVANGVVYFGSGDGRLYAVDAETGKERWRFETGGAVHGSAAVAGGLVYISSRDHYLYALDAQTGNLEWKFATGEELPFEWGWDYYLSSPAVVDGSVYFGSGDGNLYAVDGLTGQEKWRFKTGSRLRSSPAVYQEGVYVGGMDGRLHAVDRLSGESKWTFETEGASLDSTTIGFDRTSIQSSPAVLEGAIVFGSRDGHLYSVDLDTGKQRWRFDHEVSWVISAPTFSSDLVLAGTSDGHFFNAVNLSSGEEKWRFKVPKRIFSSGAVADGVVFFGCFDGNLFALDAGTGEELWRFRTADSVMSSPVVKNGVVYFGSDDGRLYALTGKASDEPGRPLPRKAVFWRDSKQWKWYRGDETTRDYLTAEGYELLDDESLAVFFEERVADDTPSVVVSTVDSLPQSVLGQSSAPGLLRRYLDAGGKVVWLGFAPFALVMDPQTGQPTGMDESGLERILGIDQSRVDAAKYGAEATDEGIRWGMPPWWVGAMAIESEHVTTVLGIDENGKTSAWVKSFGGPEGTGFIRLWGRQEPIADLSYVKAVAEYGIR